MWALINGPGAKFATTDNLSHITVTGKVHFRTLAGASEPSRSLVKTFSAASAARHQHTQRANIEECCLVAYRASTVSLVAPRAPPSMYTLAVAVLLVAALHLTHAAPLNVTVFTKGEAGYYCHKIPYLVATARGSLLAFAEARGKFGPFECQVFRMCVCPALTASLAPMCSLVPRTTQVFIKIVH